jgi:hypothetical protein
MAPLIWASFDAMDEGGDRRAPALDFLQCDVVCVQYSSYLNPTKRIMMILRLASCIIVYVRVRARRARTHTHTNTLSLSLARSLSCARSLTLLAPLELVAPLELMCLIIPLGNGLDKGACTARPICGPPACR